MKNKKYYIKKNLISFIIGLIIFGGVGVYAAVTFPSNEVTYDNTDSGLSSTNVKGAIDELYTECTKEPPAGETIIDNAGLEKDPYECRYFFTGGNPNNYITFNGEKAGWRIISVECDGTIKIMKNTDIGSMQWDTSRSNNWARPAFSNTHLNGIYYNGLNATAKNQIVAKDWGIGGVTYGYNNLATQINNENGTKWNGNIALPTISEYLRTNSDKNICGTFSLYVNNYFRGCIDTGWMDNNNYWWTLSSHPDEFSSVYYLRADGAVDGSYANDIGAGLRPALYLSSDVTLSGSGTQSDPYVVN